jgi:hypothetical protein
MFNAPHMTATTYEHNEMSLGHQEPNSGLHHSILAELLQGLPRTGSGKYIIPHPPPGPFRDMQLAQQKSLSLSISKDSFV